ncbi:DNA polymerase III, clamp loader complex, gamma/delta/delta subunit [Syncephalis plumigaleata]|nr:DNA polymerase III, clamp loader complex, gamma/delta/delta subunit [Syncephalis plumigaleata]
MSTKENPYVECPVCNKWTHPATINDHIDSGCTRNAIRTDQLATAPSTPLKSVSKKRTHSTESPFVASQETTTDTAAVEIEVQTNKRPALSTPKSADSPLKRSSPFVKSSTTTTTTSSNTSPSTVKIKDEHLPLSERLRPRSLDDMVGQTDLIGPNGILRHLIVSDRVPSMILWGPPGTGKTTIARMVAEYTRGLFKELSGSVNNVSDLREAFNRAKNHLALTGQRTILFVDEIHRLNRGQQDIFLPHVERGTFILIGATTENPSFRVCSALLSRCRVFTLTRLNKDNIRQILERGIRLVEQKQTFNYESDALDHMALMSDGDARVAAQALQLAVDIATSRGESLNKEMVETSFKKSHLLYDQAGEEHYNLASAMIKSMRGSDASAAMYWMYRMLASGEDPLFIARRMVIFASEDIGLADSQALVLATQTYQACQILGRPECDYPLSHCAIYLSEAPKSIRVKNALMTIRSVVETEESWPVPYHLRNAPTQLMKTMGYGVNYKYPPDYDWKEDQQYLPVQLQGRQFVEPPTTTTSTTSATAAPNDESIDEQDI